MPSKTPSLPVLLTLLILLLTQTSSAEDLCSPEVATKCQVEKPALCKSMGQSCDGEGKCICQWTCTKTGDILNWTDPLCMFDCDLDGFPNCAKLIPDCDDKNPQINQGQEEICADKIDNDCNPHTKDDKDCATTTTQDSTTTTLAPEETTTTTAGLETTISQMTTTFPPIPTTTIALDYETQTSSTTTTTINELTSSNPAIDSPAMPELFYPALIITLLSVVFALSRMRDSGPPVFIEPASLKFFIDNGALKKYKLVYTLPIAIELYPKLNGLKSVKTVKLDATDELKASKMALDHGLTILDAKTVVAAQKKNVNKIILLYDLPQKLKDEIKPLKLSLTQDETH